MGKKTPNVLLVPVMKRRLHLLGSLFVFIVILGAFSLWITDRQASVSPELRFTDVSYKGLPIVPASCPSNPHYVGQCDDTAPPPSGRCKLTASSYTVSPGQSTTLTWEMHTTDYFTGSVSGSILPGGIYAPGISGSVTVSPSATTIYKYQGQEYLFGLYPIYSEWCTTQVTVEDHQSCPIGYVSQGGQCVLSSCPLGYTLSSTGCINTGCPVGYTLQGSQCVFTGCPAGYFQQNGQCVLRQCASSYQCQGNNLYYQSVSCDLTFARTCTYGCGADACNPPPAPTGALTVSPAVVQRNAVTHVSWSAENVVIGSCSVKGTNGDSWAGASGMQTSGPIPVQSTYTLTCTGLDESTLKISKVVNIVPGFCETGAPGCN